MMHENVIKSHFSGTILKLKMSLKMFHFEANLELQNESKIAIFLMLFEPLKSAKNVADHCGNQLFCPKMKAKNEAKNDAKNHPKCCDF